MKTDVRSTTVISLCSAVIEEEDSEKTTKSICHFNMKFMHDKT